MKRAAEEDPDTDPAAKRAAMHRYHQLLGMRNFTLQVSVDMNNRAATHSLLRTLEKHMPAEIRVVNLCGGETPAAVKALVQGMKMVLSGQKHILADQLPTEILVEIFKRVPDRPGSRKFAGLRLVCRSWRDVLDGERTFARKKHVDIYGDSSMDSCINSLQACLQSMATCVPSVGKCKKCEVAHLMRFEEFITYKTNLKKNKNVLRIFRGLRSLMRSGDEDDYVSLRRRLESLGIGRSNDTYTWGARDHANKVVAVLILALSEILWEGPRHIVLRMQDHLFPPDKRKILQRERLEIKMKEKEEEKATAVVQS